MLDALRYESIRLRSLRSTWILLATGLVVQFLLGLEWATHSDMTVNHRFTNSFLGLFLVLVVLPGVAVAVNAFGHEYRYRTITTTKLTLRAPGRILGAKAIVVGVFGAVSGAALVGVTLLAEALVGGMPTDSALVGHALLGSVVFAVLSCLIGLSVAELSRNGTVALVAMIVFPAIIETGLSYAKFPQSLLPFQGGEQFLVSGDPGRWAQPLPLLVLAAVLLAASWASLRRRDA
ncbi:MAG TPA: ABC transporter permease [Pseudonocardiaceae bacterium]|nr:ABC transporter permease [Pseudonocardiaceae bacterium]